jgi:hypothetical protein
MPRPDRPIPAERKRRGRPKRRPATWRHAHRRDSDRSIASAADGAMRAALFVYSGAADAGFSFRRAAPGKLEVLGPPGVAPELCKSTVATIRAHAAEILRLLRWFDAEADEGRIWAPSPGLGTRQ